MEPACNYFFYQRKFYLFQKQSTFPEKFIVFTNKISDRISSEITENTINQKIFHLKSKIFPHKNKFVFFLDDII